MQNVCQPLLKSFARPGTRSLLAGLTALGRHGTRKGYGLASTATVSGRCRGGGLNILRRPDFKWKPASENEFHTQASLLARKARPQKHNSTAVARVEDLDGRLKIKIPFGPRNSAELSTIFGQAVNFNEGNEVLRILHGRRVSGALIDRGTVMDKVGTDIPSEALERAMEWLREHYPVDEQTAADAWADMEARKLEAEYIARAERLGLYKPMEKAQESRDSDNSIYGKSVLEERRRHVEEREQRIAKEKESSGEAQNEKELALARTAEREQQQLARRQKREARMAEWQKKGQVSDMKEVPELSNWTRLAGPTMLSVLVILAAFIFAENYEAPTRFERAFPEVPASVATFGTFLAINGVVFLAWRIPTLWRLLNKYTVVAPGYPVAFSLFGNTFSHATFAHFSGNMAALALFGIPLHEEIGRGNWVALYVMGGTGGALVSLWGHVAMRRFTTSSRGASGAVYCIAAAWLYNFICKGELPDADNQWPFILDVTRAALILFSGLSHCLPAYWAFADGLAHMGGFTLGLIGAKMIRFEKRRLEKESEEERTQSKAAAESDRAS